MKVESESEAAQSRLTLSDPLDHSLPGFSVHGIFQARVLEWGAIAFSGQVLDAKEPSDLVSALKDHTRQMILLETIISYDLHMRN